MTAIVLLLAVATVRPAPATAASQKGPADVAPAEAWDCGGMTSPGDGVFRTEAAFVCDDQPDAAQQAIERARRNLLERLCGGRSDCAELAAQITPWKHGTGHGYACALAVIDEVAYGNWLRRTSPAALRERLRPAAEELLRKLGLEGRSPTFMMGLVKDDEVPGGRRVEALLPLMQLALQDAGAVATVAPPPRSRTELPAGVDIVLEGSLLSQPGGLVRVSWSGLARSSRKRGALQYVVGEPFTIAAALLGAPPKTLYPGLPEGAGEVTVRLDTRAGGGICAGQTSQIWLRSDRKRHVRVIDLYGDEALLIFPNVERPEGQVDGGADVALAGPQGFVAYPAGSDAERFLVLAADREEELGPFARLTNYCRFSPDAARRLRKGEGLPPRVQVTSTGYRVLEGRGCPPPDPSTPTAAQAAAWLEQVPLCDVR